MLHKNTPITTPVYQAVVIPSNDHLTGPYAPFSPERPKRFLYRDEPSRHRLMSVEDDGTEYRVITFEAEDARLIKRVVDVVGKLLRRHGPLFKTAIVRGREVRCKSKLCAALLDLLRGSPLEVADRSGDKQRMHPYFEVFTTLMQRMGTPIHFDHAPPEALDAFVNSLKEQCSTPYVRRQIDNAKRVARENTRSALRLLRAARSGYSKVLALRFDLEYVAAYSPSIHPSSLAEELMRTHREEFLALLREGPYAKHLIGYVWKTEWGLQRGFHHHMLVLMTGQAVCADIRIADDLCNRWKKDVTHGAGAFENCNKKKELYQRCGIGMLDRNDDQKWAYLDEATIYLAKNNVYTKSLLSKSTQCFGVGGPYMCGTSAPAKRRRLKVKRLPGPPKRV